MSQRLRLVVDVEPRVSGQTIRTSDVQPVDVKSQFGPLGTFGLIVIALSIVLLLASAVVFLISYPDTYYAVDGTPQAQEDRKVAVELVNAFAGIGALSLLFGTSTFLFGRSLVGSKNFQEEHQFEEA